MERNPRQEPDPEAKEPKQAPDPKVTPHAEGVPVGVPAKKHRQVPAISYDAFEVPDSVGDDPFETPVPVPTRIPVPAKVPNAPPRPGNPPPPRAPVREPARQPARAMVAQAQAMATVKALYNIDAIAEIGTFETSGKQVTAGNEAERGIPNVIRAGMAETATANTYAKARARASGVRQPSVRTRGVANAMRMVRSGVVTGAPSGGGGGFYFNAAARMRALMSQVSRNQAQPRFQGGVPTD